MRGITECRVVRHFAQLERAAQLAPLGDERHQAAVVDAEHLADAEEREELRLREVVTRAGRVIARQRRVGERQRGAREPHGRLRHRARGKRHPILQRAALCYAASIAPVSLQQSR